METFCTTSRHSKYRPTLNSNNFYQTSTYSRNFRQNEYCFTNSARNSVLLRHERIHPPIKKSKRRFCSVALAVVAFVVLFAVLSIAGLALYMGTLRTDASSSLVSFSCSAKVSRGDRFLSGLQEKARRYRLLLETLYQKSVLGPSLVSCAVEKFGNDTFTIFFKLTLNNRKLPRQMHNVEKTIKDILLSDAVARKPIFRNVRFDPRSISIKQTVDSESYQRVITKPKEVPKTRPGVLMKPPQKTNLTLSADLPVRKRPVIEEVDIKEDDLPVIQGSFKITKTEADLTEKKTIPSTETTQKPKIINITQTTRKSTVKETSITSALFKLASSEKTSSTTTTTSTTPTTTTTKTTETTTTTTSTTTTTTTTTTTPKPFIPEFKYLTTKSSTNPYLNPLLFSVSPNLLNQEPWVPIYDNKPSTKLDAVPTSTGINHNNQPIYTSFTNPGLSFHSLDAEKLGSTSLQGHPIPVNKIPVTESISEVTTKTADVYFSTDAVLSHAENKQDEFDLYDLQTSDVNADEGFVEVETLKYVPGSTSSVLNESLVKLNETRVIDEDSYKLKQSTVLKNISSIFHSLASSLGISPTHLVKSVTEKPVEAVTEEVKDTGNIVGQGQAEVVDADEISLLMQTTKLPLVTLMPVKSNSGVGRPIRPRPKLKRNPPSNNQNDSLTENRSFPSNTKLKANFYLETPIKYVETEVVTSVSSELSKVKLNKSQLTDFDVASDLKFEVEVPVEENTTTAEEVIPEDNSDEASEDLSEENVETLNLTTIDSLTPTQEEYNFEDEVAILSMNSSTTRQSDESVQYLSPEKLKQLSEISKLSNNQSNEDDVISTKAVSSSYTINHAGFKILTKTFNKTPNSFKEEEKKIASGYNSFYLNISNKSECSNFTVKCGDGQCLPDTTRCNQLVDCNDGSDEKNCNCADYLRSQFLLRKICDGIVDCWDFSDENQCDWCTPGQYVCGNSKVCINRTSICDGVRDCPHGDDERQCVTVAPNVNAADEFPYYSEGYLMVRKHGQWGKLCVDNFQTVVSKSRTAWEIEDLGQAVCKAMTYQSLDHVKILTENKLKSIYRNTKYYELAYSFLNATKSSLSFEKTSCNTGEVVRVKCQSLECGARPQAAKQVARRSYRIVGGGNAGLGAWPWQAALYKEGEFQCGATLISDKWLLSAGHCFYHSLEDHWVARLGALRRGTALPSPYEQLRPIVEIILHPGYVDAGFINDISLLKMEVPVIFSDYVRPICLPPSGVAPRDGILCTVVGWGQLFEIGRIFPDTLQEVQLPVISTAECRKRTLFLPLYRVTDDMFCAGYDRGGRDACLGDSGGPLMCPESDGRWVLHGITSNGYGCARAYRPGVYTKVSNYIVWINSHIKSENNEKAVIKSTCLGHRCPLGECLPKSRLCNGFIECSDGSDEAGCLNN